MEPKLLRFSLAFAAGALSIASCVNQPIGGGGSDGGVPDACVETQLCVVNAHWDSHLCKCVPNDAGTGALQWYATCGDPVCRGYTATSGVPLCTADQMEGAACTVPGQKCDPQSDCNALLICATADPKLGVGGCPISSRQFKDHIEYVDSTGLQQLAEQAEHVRLATYQYKNDLAGRKHLGFIIEDQPNSPAVELDRDRVDLYGYTSMAVAALQVQQKQIEALQQQVTSLQQELASARGNGAMCSTDGSH